MDRESVTSSNIASVGYDAGSSVLEVEFKKGGIYQYFDVPPSVHIEMLQGESVGKYFAANVKDAFRYSRV